MKYKNYIWKKKLKVLVLASLIINFSIVFNTSVEDEYTRIFNKYKVNSLFCVPSIQLEELISFYSFFVF